MVGGVATCVLAMLVASPLVSAQSTDPRTFSDTGFVIDNDAIWNFYSQNGGTDVFGEPISRDLSLAGMSNTVQLFDRAALAVQNDGSVQPLALADPPLLPYTTFGGLSLPAIDPATTFVAPTPDQPNYAARVPIFVDTVVPDPFLTTFNSLGGAPILGLPTSPPKPDPNNPRFVYQRFDTTILMNDMDAGTTQPLLMGQYFKEVLENQGLPADLAAEAANSPLLGALANSDVFAPAI